MATEKGDMTHLLVHLGAIAIALLRPETTKLLLRSLLEP